MTFLRASYVTRQAEGGQTFQRRTLGAASGCYLLSFCKAEGKGHKQQLSLSGISAPRLVALRAAAQHGSTALARIRDEVRTRGERRPQTRGLARACQCG